MLALQRQHDADGQRERPDRRYEIGHRAHREVHPPHGGDAALTDDRQVLQVSLCPAAISDDEVHQVRRQPFVGPVQGRHHVNAPTRALQQHSLDEIVTLDMAAEWCFAGEVWKPRGAGKRDRADDGVVTPIVALIAMPEGETSSDRRTVDIGSELLQPLQQRRATGEARDRLDQSGEGIPFHCESEADDGLAGHHAVGIGIIKLW